ncbi:DUF3667 domain-containing protein [Chitinophaga silvisoli]|uniref:DUF3667 domain-containing protein n=1 Tax=Chitinophaga silvisoli TaxID=2291814 RepID=A0A3E1NXX4_9BACT|nr:DUF3667 domain-containing protein [Chitinophaga silvisoli]RFM32781.1 DUF3667 domain-containing protein [Chitinophaga silvisoli]
MKTQPIRAEKNCLNCGTEVPERYCTHCGQENTVPHESFGHLFHHFFADVIHYDSKTLTTLKYLLFRPGFLTQEYTAGKRVRYVNPIKLYIFTSFVFFFCYFTFTHEEKEKAEKATVLTTESYTIGNTDPTDSIAGAWKNKLEKYHNEDEYLDAQKALPKSERDGFITRQAIRQYFKQKERKEKGEEGIDERFQHNYPKMMFVLLPLFALYLKWIYHRRKKWYYADHAIFSLHFHSFFFIFYLFTAILDWLFNVDFISLSGLIVIFIYLMLSMKRIYGGKSFWKAFSLVLVYSFSLLLVFVVFSIIISFLT